MMHPPQTWQNVRDTVVGDSAGDQICLITDFSTEIDWNLLLAAAKASLNTLSAITECH